MAQRARLEIGTTSLADRLWVSRRLWIEARSDERVGWSVLLLLARDKTRSRGDAAYDLAGGERASGLSPLRQGEIEGKAWTGGRGDRSCGERQDRSGCDCDRSRGPERHWVQS